MAIEYEHQDGRSVYDVSWFPKHPWKMIKRHGISIEFDILSVPEPKVYIDADRGLIKIENDNDPYTKDPMDIDEAKYIEVKGTTSDSVSSTDKEIAGMRNVDKYYVYIVELIPSIDDNVSTLYVMKGRKCLSILKGNKVCLKDVKMRSDVVCEVVVKCKEFMDKEFIDLLSSYSRSMKGDLIL